MLRKIGQITVRFDIAAGALHGTETRYLEGVEVVENRLALPRGRLYRRGLHYLLVADGIRVTADMSSSFATAD